MTYVYPVVSRRARGVSIGINFESQQCVQLALSILSSTELDAWHLASAGFPAL